MLVDLTRIIPQTKDEIKEYQKLERLRERERQRQERVFNEKQLLMGLDVEAISLQIQEKKEKKQLAKDEESNYYRRLVENVETACDKTAETERAKRALAKSIDTFRLTVQRKEFRREYDLNYDDGYTEVPFMRYEMEDEDGEKERLIKHHQRCLLIKQISEKWCRKQEEKLANLREGTEIVEQDKAVNICAKNAEQLKKYAAKEVMEYNLRKADYERVKRQEILEETHEDDRAHVQNCLQQILLTETPLASKSGLGLGKVCQYYYRGMQPNEKREIFAEQQRQMEAKKQLHLAEKAVENHWKHVEELQVREKSSKLEEQLQQKRGTAKGVFLENMRLAEIQAMQRKLMNIRAVDNYPTEEYYNYFNRSSR